MIKNILWSVNGILFDTYPAVTYSFSKALGEMGISVALNVIDGLVRRSFDDCVETLSGRFKLDRSLLRGQFCKFYRTISPANQPPFPGVREVCEFIHQNRGFNIAFTDGSMESARRLIEAHQFSPLVDHVLSLKEACQETSDPCLLPAILEKHRLIPAETLLIAGRIIDRQAGQSVGVRTCLFGKAEHASLAGIQIEKYSDLIILLTSEGGSF